jgi:hypothetical protein
MNIFFLSRDPAEAARYHNDKHVVKMILEYAQLLSTAHRLLDGNDKGVLSDERDSVLYKATHKNHPSAVWVRRELDNYRWVHDLLYFLIGEFRFRYGKPHATERLQPLLLEAPYNIPIGESLVMEDPPQCMPDDSKNSDTVLAYRTYYAKHKYHIANWKKRGTPEWWDETVQRIHS